MAYGDTKRFLNLEGLQLYDNKIKGLIDEAKAAGVNAQQEIDALESYVGKIPTGYTEDNIVAFILKVAEETLSQASGGSSESAASVLAALNAYKALNDPKVEANTNDIAEIKADYLKAADKTELSNAIAAEKTRAEAAEKANADVIAAVKEDVDTFFKDANLTESAKDTLKEIQEYIDSDVEAAAAMTASIQENTAAIAAEKSRAEGAEATITEDLNTFKTTVAETYETKANVATQIQETKAYIDAEIEKLDNSASAAIGAVGERVANIEVDYAKKGDAQAYANTAETNAKTYADGLAVNYDAVGAANQALTDAKAYVDAAYISEAEINALFA